MRKRILVLSLIGVILISGTGCGETAGNNEILTADPGPMAADTEQVNVESVEEAGADEERAYAEQTDAEQNDTLQISIEKSDMDVEVNTEAVKFVENMKIGWNLGNTLDAYTDQNKADEMAYESDWCGIVTTKEMVDAVKAAGFQTIRIPVSWHNHVSNDGNYTISGAWLNRVQEVVDYAVDNDMYIIINIHHDNSIGYIYPSKEYLEQSKAYVAAIWTQVAARFADYDGHLIMEGLNEPRLVGTSSEWWLDFNKKECVEAVQCINELNQLFVDTVRSSGGHNAERYLLVPGYAGSLQGVTNEYFDLPQDTESNQNKILVEVHGYTPQNFALQAPGEAGSTDQWSVDSAASTSEIDGMMDALYEKYVRNGIGVVIDEFGARDKGSNTQARTDFASYYVAAARARGITCCWWDNNSFTGSGENFGIFRRTSCQFEFPELVESMMKSCE